MTQKMQVVIKIYKIIFFGTRIFFKNFQHQIALTVIDSKNVKWYPNSASFLPITIIVFFPNNLLHFAPFPGRAENKKYYRSLTLLKKSVLQIMIEVLSATKKIGEGQVSLHRLVMRFLVENVLHGNKLKHRISVTICHRFFSLFDHVLGK